MSKNFQRHKSIIAEKTPLVNARFRKKLQMKYFSTKKSLGRKKFVLSMKKEVRDFFFFFKNPFSKPKKFYGCDFLSIIARSVSLLVPIIHSLSRMT